MGGGEVTTEKGRESNPKLYALLHEMAGRYAVSADTIVVAWLLRHPAHIQPVFGSRTPQRIKVASDAVKVNLDRNEWFALLEAARGKAAL
jgi:predicted oxidoreductase